MTIITPLPYFALAVSVGYLVLSVKCWFHIPQLGVGTVAAWFDCSHAGEGTRMAETNARPPETIADLERHLHTEIPLTRSMQVCVLRADRNGLVLGAALAPNLNHKQTAFGGSLNSLATLACWGFIRLLVRDCGPAITIVIQESNVEFLRPIRRNFAALCTRPDEAIIEKFLLTLGRKGRARLALDATIDAEGEVALRFHGKFVAYDRQRFRDFDSAAIV